MFMSSRCVLQVTKLSSAAPRNLNGTQFLPAETRKNFRFIFSDSYLGIDRFQRKRNSVRLTMTDENEFKQELGENFGASGLRSIFGEDILKLINLVEGDSDLELLKKILLACIADEGRSFGALSKFVNMYFLLCKMLNNIDAARNMWIHEAFRAARFSEQNVLRTRFFQLLYDSKCYQEVANEVHARLTEMPKEVRIDEITMGMACLAKLKTPEALKEAKSLFTYWAKCGGRGSRTKFLYSWLAISMGEYGTAYDLLTDRFLISKPCILSTNLRLSILVDVGRLEEAFLLIRSDILPPPGMASLLKESKFASEEVENGDDESFVNGLSRTRLKTRVVCFGCMKVLADAIKAKQNKELTKELTLLCQSLDASASLTEETLEELVFSPISRPLKRHRDETSRSNRAVQRQSSLREY